MKLVPCRWSNTGWKYVEVQPSTHRFFGNPNRTNFHGFTAAHSEKKSKAGNADFRYKQDAKDAYMTTNEKFYSPYISSPAQKWNQMKTTGTRKGGVLKNGPETTGFQWAGEFHRSRTDFHRSRDHLADWTRVLFRP